MFGLLRKLLVCSILLGSAISYGETPTPPKPSTPKQESSSERAQKAEKDVRGTKESPISVELLNTGKSKNETEREAKHEEDKSFHEFILNVFTGILAVATASLAIITGFLVRYTKNLWGATGHLVTGAKETAKNELRGYVGIAKNHILKGQGETEPHCVELVIKNFGKTMAKDTQIWICATITTNPITVFPLGERISKTVVMPHESLGFQHDIVLPKTTPGSIYFWGRIEYKDVFGEPHWTTFRFMDDKPAWLIGRSGQAGEWTTKTCDEDNDAN